MNDNSLLRKLLVTSVERETSSAINISLQPLDNWKPQARSGQFVTLLFESRHSTQRRSYSISSCPELGEPLRITVKKIDNGEISRPLNYFTKAGDVMLCTGMHGLFVLPAEIGDQHFVFLAAGSGITPCFALIKLLLYRHTNRVTLIYSNKTVAETIFFDQITLLQKEFSGRFSVRFLFSDSQDITGKRLSKWLLEQLLDKYVKDTAKTLFYLCGPFSYMQMCRITLLNRAGKSQIFQEDFEHHPRLILPEPPDNTGYNVTIHIRGQTFEVPVRYPVSVTRAAARLGIQLPFSCEAGRCASCIATVTKGRFWMSYNEVLTDREVQAGRVLACQAYPVGGDAAISYE